MATTDIINFRATPEVARWLQEVASDQNRSRSNLLNTLLSRVLNPDRQAQLLEQIVSWIHREDEEHCESDYGDYLRGSLHGAKWMLQTLLGDSAKDRALEIVRKRLGKPIPHIGIRAEDGRGRLGWDSDAG